MVEKQVKEGHCVCVVCFRIALHANSSQSYGDKWDGITQCYLPPDTGKCTLHWPQQSRPVLDLPTTEGWKAELTWVVGYIPI